MKAIVRFVDERLESEYTRLLTARSDGKDLHRWLSHAMEAITCNAFCGTQLPKRPIPNKFKGISNLWKYDLPRGWRLMYTIEGKEVKLVALLLTWLDHKEYEKLLGYHVRDRERIQLMVPSQYVIP